MCTLLAAGTASAQNYWQQRVDHVIRVRLDDQAHMLHGQETFTYTNNSPAALDTLWLHLWPNAYRERGTALCEQLDGMNDPDLHFAEEKDRGWIDSLDLMASGTRLAWGEHPQHPDIAWVKLPATLPPGGSVAISTPFRVKIPDGRFSRLGHTGQAYYITQWFPKPAVYDAQGWHAMPYLTQGEFYSEFGRYDVSITLPANYVVGATGVLQDARERAWLDSLSSDERVRPELIREIGTGKPSNAFPPSSPATKTIRYVQDNVHDFAWFADKRFIVERDEIVLARSGRHVTTWTMYTPRNADLWKGSVSYVGASVNLYSQWVGDYPYDECTAVDGTISAGGGMEYPMITIIGNMDSKESLDNVIAHEVGHNWFYGILGSNERDHAWMDEGMNSFVELRYMRERYPKGGLNVQLPFVEMSGRGDLHHLQSELMYRLNARRNLDQPIEQTSAAFTPLNYGAMVYGKTALVMDHLMAYLGEETMDKCLNAYFEEFKFKHPQPEDLRRVFERESGKDLGWVFEGLLGTDQKYDVKAVSLDRRIWEGGVERMHLGHRAKGPWAVPFPITGYAGEDSLGTVWAWNNGFGHQGRTEYAGLPWDNVDRVRIDAGARTLDIDRRNNGDGTKLQLRFLSGLERDDRRTIYWAPLLGANAHDGFMAGLALHNHAFPSQRFEWVLAPMYGFTSEELVGGARAEYHFDRLRSDLFRNIHLGASTWGFSTQEQDGIATGFRKYTPSIRFDVERDLMAAQHAFAYRAVFVDQRTIGTVTGDEGPTTGQVTTSDTYHELRYGIGRNRGLYPFTITGIVLHHAAFTRASAEAKWSAIFDKDKHRVTLRAFVGTFLRKEESELQRLMAWRLNWGNEDLLYDNIALARGRSDVFAGQQIGKTQGGFKTPTAQGGSDSWIGALNLELDAPFKLPISLYANAGAAPITEVDAQGNRTSSWDSYYEMGLGFRIVRDVAEVWFPLAVSKNIKDEQEFQELTFGQTIRFVLALEKLDPTRIVRNINP
ncbi:MAG: M1 family metallopeptidase [Flavobacteriales bacterium]|nr:M1 family metallopeptidase [Flavobacteriales bacterium]